MAKKAKTSARSKGYRKTVQKKPFLTKKEIIALVVIVAVIALAVILFNLLYDDGSLDVVDGVVQTENLENSLIATDVVGDETKYFKVGEAGEVAGYTRERVENTADANLATFDYYPEDETSPISYLHVGAGGGTPDALMQTVTLSYTMSGVPIDAQGETEIDGRAIQYMITSGEYAIEEESRGDGRGGADCGSGRRRDWRGAGKRRCDCGVRGDGRAGGGGRGDGRRDGREPKTPRQPTRRPRRRKPPRRATPASRYWRPTCPLS